ncbi:fimbrial protein [Atlantibacter sp.]|uniref:fimbrial protein n=1 Tax=Atlantibacter sp. TaxID=1903473 RepID=UPI0028A8C9C8|nr:fimbrial protein [Atlantibacter sp.]
MKKSFLGLAISTLFMVGAAQADVSPNDVSATLNVTGAVTHQFSCVVNLSKPTVNISDDVDSLTAQGTNGTSNPSVQSVEISTTGDQECSTAAIAYKFLGTADSADGTSLANNAGVDGATGVGVALYDISGNIIKVNQDTMLAKPDSGVTQLLLGLVKLNNQTPKAGTINSSVTVQIERL